MKLNMAEKSEFPLYKQSGVKEWRT